MIPNRNCTGKWLKQRKKNWMAWNNIWLAFLMKK
jgi:hypothetical protein